MVCSIVVIRRAQKLREWMRDGRVVDDLTYRVYDEMNIGLLHPDGARHEYPQEYPLVLDHQMVTALGSVMQLLTTRVIRGYNRLSVF